MDSTKIKVLQINVNHSNAAHSAAFLVARDLGIDILSIQDPALSQAKIPLTILKADVFSSKKKGR